MCVCKATQFVLGSVNVGKMKFFFVSFSSGCELENSYFHLFFFLDDLKKSC